MPHEQLHPTHHEHAAETPVLHDRPDDWHDHTKDEKPQTTHGEVVNANTIMGIGISLFLVIVFASAAVYAYYTWFLIRQLNEQEIATGKDSPALVAVRYKRDALLRLERGGNVDVPAKEPAPAMKYSVTKMEDAVQAMVKTYSAPAPLAPGPLAPGPSAPGPLAPADKPALIPVSP